MTRDQPKCSTSWAEDATALPAQSWLRDDRPIRQEITVLMDTHNNNVELTLWYVAIGLAWMAPGAICLTGYTMRYPH